MSRVGLFVGLVSGLFICKLVGIGDGSFAKEAYWMGIALFNHWLWDEVILK